MGIDKNEWGFRVGHLPDGERNKISDVPGVTVADLVLRPQRRHGRVDGLQAVKSHLLQLAAQPVEDQAAGESIIRRPMVVEFRQAEGIGHNVQLELPQLRQVSR